MPAIQLPDVALEQIVTHCEAPHVVPSGQVQEIVLFGLHGFATGPQGTDATALDIPRLTTSNIALIEYFICFFGVLLLFFLGYFAKIKPRGNGFHLLQKHLIFRHVFSCLPSLEAKLVCAELGLRSWACGVGLAEDRRARSDAPYL